jgi:hypothetical protein
MRDPVGGFLILRPMGRKAINIKRRNIHDQLCEKGYHSRSRHY